MQGGDDGDGDDGGVAAGAVSQETRHIFRSWTSDCAVRHVSQELLELWCFHCSYDACCCVVAVFSFVLLRSFWYCFVVARVAFVL